MRGADVPWNVNPGRPEVVQVPHAHTHAVHEARHARHTHAQATHTDPPARTPVHQPVEAVRNQLKVGNAEVLHGNEPRVPQRLHHLREACTPAPPGRQRDSDHADGHACDGTATAGAPPSPFEAHFAAPGTTWWRARSSRLPPPLRPSLSVRAALLRTLTPARVCVCVPLAPPALQPRGSQQQRA